MMVRLWDCRSAVARLRISDLDQTGASDSVTKTVDSHARRSSDFDDRSIGNNRPPRIGAGEANWFADQESDAWTWTGSFAVFREAAANRNGRRKCIPLLVSRVWVRRS
jgi:hypothetical protein